MSKYKKGEIVLLECEYEGDIKQLENLHKVRVRIMRTNLTEGIQLIVHEEVIHHISSSENNN